MPDNDAKLTTSFTLLEGVQRAYKFRLTASALSGKLSDALTSGAPDRQHLLGWSILLTVLVNTPRYWTSMTDDRKVRVLGSVLIEAMKVSLDRGCPEAFINTGETKFRYNKHTSEVEEVTGEYAADVATRLSSCDSLEADDTRRELSVSVRSLESSLRTLRISEAVGDYGKACAEKLLMKTNLLLMGGHYVES